MCKGGHTHTHVRTHKHTLIPAGRVETSSELFITGAAQPETKQRSPPRAAATHILINQNQQFTNTTL